MVRGPQGKTVGRVGLGHGEHIVLLLVVAVLATIKLVAHYRFGTSFDSALLGNVAWRLGSGLDSVSTLTGFQYFATHASGVILLLAPIFRLWPDAGLPITFIWQALSIGLVGLATAQVASSFGLSPLSRRLLLVLMMLSPGPFLATRLDVHEPTLGLGFLAMTLSSGLSALPVRRSWWWPVLSAACRIEMAVATMIAGLLLARSGRSRRSGVIAILAGLVGLSFSLWFISRSGNEAVSVAAHFAHLGSTVGEVIQTAVTDPLDVLRPLGEPVMLASLVLWLLPMGILLPLLGWRFLLVALPMAGVAMLGVWAPADQYSHHYWYGFLVAAPLAAAEALRRRPHLVKLLGVTGLIGLTIGWAGLISAMPILRPFGRDDDSTLRQMIAYVSANEPLGLSAPDSVVPHLVGRAELYAFPRPFLCSEGSVGPFAWSGRAPDLVLIRESDIAQVEADPVLGSDLAQLYVPDAVENQIAAYRLETPGLSGLRCASR